MFAFPSAISIESKLILHVNPQIFFKNYLKFQNTKVGLHDKNDD